MSAVELLNSVMRPFSMYKGILLGLSGIWLSALALAFVGQLNFTVLDFLLSTAVLVGSTFLASLLCGWLFGIKIHADSSFITGLILAFLFTPSADISQLVLFAFVGLIAGVSKFIITWRGRHIFNPAALAVFVVSLAGLGAASWWVATPLLTPVVLLVAAVAVYQSKRYALVGTFLAITIPALFIQFLAFGATPAEGLWLLMAWPVLFLAGIMLTEPLTLPPRKWQGVVVAAVVAVAFLLPVEVGSFQMTPAAALLLGNLVAFVLARRQAVTLTLKERKRLTPSTEEFVFTPSVPVPFSAGQYMEVMLPHKRADFRGVRRRFSIVSAPSSDDIRFGIKFYEPSSSFKRTLRSLEAGATLQVSTIEGDFVLPKDSSRPLLLVAGGIGITPYISQLQCMRSRKEKRDIVLVYAVSAVGEIAYESILKKSGIRVIIVAPEKPKHLPDGWVFAKGTRLSAETISECIPDAAERWAYVSGPTPFVATVKKLLKRAGVRAVKTDYFTGY